MRLLNVLQVIINRGLPRRSRRGRKKTSAAQTDHFEARFASLAGYSTQITSFERLTPDGDAAHAALGELHEAFLKAQRLGGDGVYAKSVHERIMEVSDDKKKMILRC
jgi:hypothetical protein